LNFKLICKGHGIKLKGGFIRNCKALETQFVPLISDTTIESDFVNFLNERYKDVKNMKEVEFRKHILNVRSDIYPDFIKFPHNR
jgi:hypothetical protein